MSVLDWMAAVLAVLGLGFSAAAFVSRRRVLRRRRWRDLPSRLPTYIHKD